MFELLDNYVKIGGARYKKAGLEWQEFGTDSVIFTRDGVLVGPGPVRYDQVTDPDTGQPFADLATFTTYLDANFFDATGGGNVTGGFVMGVAPAWSGNKYFEVSEDTNLVTGAGAGEALIKNMGDHAVTINDVEIATNAADYKGGLTGIRYVKIGSNTWVRSDVDMVWLPANPAVIDVTAPTVGTVVATNAHTIDVPISEAFAGTNGFSFMDGAIALTVTARVKVGNILRHTITETMSAASVLTWAYASGDITDTATLPNALVATAGNVINSIGAAITLVLTGTNTLTEAPEGTWTTTAANDITTGKKMEAGVAMAMAWSEHTGASSKLQIHGLGLAAAATDYTGFKFYFYHNAGEVAVATDGAEVAVPDLTTTVGNLYGFKVVDNGGGTSTVTFHESSDNGTTWSAALHTFSAAFVHADLYIKYHSLAGNSGIIKNPEALNVV